MGYTAGKKVLDYGCGSGYGTALISQGCQQITGIDVSAEAIAHAQSHFNAANLSYLQVRPAEEQPLPFTDASFDVILSFQVIEHVADVSIYLAEIERLLAPGGTAILSTPDRSGRLFSFQKPWNMWHLREYTQDQLKNELSGHFPRVTVKQIGGKQEVVGIELRRTQRLKWILIPLTLPFIPESVRRNGLRLIKDLNYSLAGQKSAPITSTFDETALSISDHESFSIDLLAIADKSS